MLELKPKPFDEAEEISDSAIEAIDRKLPIMSIVLN